MDREKNRPVALVTGATGAIGKAIARQLAADHGFRVVITGRDEARTRAAAQEIGRAARSEDVNYAIVDLARRAEIEALAARWQGPLHVLINNAGTTPRQRMETPEGIEMQFATNVLGYFWMTRAFEPVLAHSAPSRVINVASYWAGDLDLDDLEFRMRHYVNGRAYRQSKQANRMLTAAFAALLEPEGILVVSCHPGDVNSKLSNDLGFGGHETPDEGARTPVWLATAPLERLENGRFYEDRRAVQDRFTQDGKAVEALYQACLAYE